VQRFAVLATNEDGQPYNCLVAIAVTSDLKHLLFITSRSTRKYTDLKKDPRVSVLIDNRSNALSDFNRALAVTATGKAWEINNEEKDDMVNIYLEKHPNLYDFVNSKENALIRIDVTEYIVSSFQNVWKIPME